MKVLVTGGAGFIGTNLVRRLVGDGHDVVVVDDLSTGDKRNVDLSEVDFRQGDIRDTPWLDDVMRGGEVVFHVAALPSVPRSIADPETSHSVNASGTLSVLEAATNVGVRRVVYSSSSSVYGLSRDLPKVETARPLPISPYAVSKLTGEHYCRAFTACFRLETVALRYFNVFGPFQQADSAYAAVIPRFISALRSGLPAQIHGDGEQTRDFTFVDNVVEANLLAATAGADAVGEVFNVGYGARASINQLHRLLSKFVDHEAVEAEHTDAREGDVRDSLADIGKAQSLLNYKPVVALEAGLERTVAWWSESSR